MNAAVYEDDVPLSTRETAVSPTKTTDVSHISLTVPMAIAMAVTIASLVGGFWAVMDRKSAEIEKVANVTASDVRDIKTTITLQAKVDEANDRADAIVQDSMKQSVDELRRQVTLLQIQYQELSKQITQRR